MTKAVRIVIEGPITPKGRPRFGNGRTYTPAKTRSYEELIGLQGRLAMRGERPWTGPLNLTVSAYLPVPKSWSTKKRQMALNGQIKPTSKPDMDNIIKLADGLNGIAWEDDSQIVNVLAHKAYAADPALIFYMVAA